MSKKTEKEIIGSGHNLHLIFGKKNLLILGLGISLMALGYLLMLGGGSSDPNVFNQKELYSNVRITVAPILVFLGIVINFYAILAKNK